MELYRRAGVMPSMKHLHSALDKLDALDIKTIACHHGSVLTGNLSPYFRAIREEDVTSTADYGVRSSANLMQE